MKKIYIIVLFLGLTLAVSPIHADTLTAEQRTTIESVIQSLLAQVAELVKQLQLVQSQQSTGSLLPQTIQAQNSTPIQSNPSMQQFYGSAQDSVTSSPVPTAMTIYTESLNDPEDHPIGWYNFMVSIKDQNGKYVSDNKVVVNMENPSDNLYKSAPGDFTKSISGTYTKDSIPVAGAFQYMPSSKGTKTITFTSGNLTTSTTVEVK